MEIFIGVAVCSFFVIGIYAAWQVQSNRLMLEITERQKIQNIRDEEVLKQRLFHLENERKRQLAIVAGIRGTGRTAPSFVVDAPVERQSAIQAQELARGHIPVGIVREQVHKIKDSKSDSKPQPHATKAGAAQAISNELPPWKPDRSCGLTPLLGPHSPLNGPVCPNQPQQATASLQFPGTGKKPPRKTGYPHAKQHDETTQLNAKKTRRVLGKKKMREAGVTDVNKPLTNTTYRQQAWWEKGTQKNRREKPVRRARKEAPKRRQAEVDHKEDGHYVGAGLQQQDQMLDKRDHLNPDGLQQAQGGMSGNSYAMSLDTPTVQEKVGNQVLDSSYLNQTNAMQNPILWATGVDSTPTPVLLARHPNLPRLKQVANTHHHTNAPSIPLTTFEVPGTLPLKPEMGNRSHESYHEFGKPSQRIPYPTLHQTAVTSTPSQTPYPPQAEMSYRSDHVFGRPSQRIPVRTHSQKAAERETSYHPTITPATAHQASTACPLSQILNPGLTPRPGPAVWE